MPNEEVQQTENPIPTEMTKELVLELINNFSGTSVDVYTDKCIHRADWTGPDEYDSFEAYISLEAETQQDNSYEIVYCIDTRNASLSNKNTSCYFTPINSTYFDDVINIIEECEESEIDRTDLIGVIANEDCEDYLLIYKTTTKEDINKIIDKIWDKTFDKLEYNYEPPEPPEPDPDECYHRYDGRWD